MELFEIFILAMVQGLTEFLPVSSSGHLVIVSALFADTGSWNARDVVEVGIVLHVGTLLSIVVFFWRRIARLLGRDRRTLGLILLGSVPAAAVGVPLKLYGADALGSPLLAGCLLPVTGLVLLLISRLPRGDLAYQRLPYLSALLIGVAQAVALLPGISRSGSTITAGLSQRLSRDSAAAFSFLLAIPALIGAGVIEARELISGDGGATPLAYLGVGVGVSFAAGYAALWWVVRWLESGRLHYFAWWCIPVGLAVVIWQLAAMIAPAAGG